MTRSVLVVEDEADILFAMRLALRLAGYRVIAAASAEEAVAVLAGERPDALVVDLWLPGMDGWEFLERLRADGVFPRLPVLVASAHASEDLERRALDAGCRGYLVKPFAARTLRAAVDALFPAGDGSPTRSIPAS